MSSNQELASAKNIDYSNLRDLLKAQSWEQSDKETLRLMLKAAGKADKNDYIGLNDITFFPCLDLLTIDKLWLKYSNGQFGFSVQKSIYMACGGEVKSEFWNPFVIPSAIPDPSIQVWQNFGRQINWIVNNSWISYANIQFKYPSVRGHLPALCWGSIGGFGAWKPSDFGSGFSVLANRLAQCEKGEPSVDEVLSKYSIKYERKYPS